MGARSFSWPASGRIMQRLGFCVSDLLVGDQ